MSEPQISVVLAVRDGGPALGGTLRSVLSQEGTALELVCVDDGSSDGTLGILADAACGDRRVRVLRQEAEGLTAALIRGCAEARSELIARQDSGDLSLPGRLAAQARLLRSDPAAAFVSCATRVVTDEGVPLYEIGQGGSRTPRGTLPAATSWPGPSHHGATMFRREAYERAGGYRRPFGVAQDFDLWLRLLELGDFVALPEILYEATFTPSALSGAHRAEQLRNARIALACARARTSGASEAPLLARCAAAPPRRAGSPRRRAQAHYFVGACLRDRPELARRQFLLALRAWPLHLRSWWRLASTFAAQPISRRSP